MDRQISRIALRCMDGFASIRNRQHFPLWCRREKVLRGFIGFRPVCWLSSFNRLKHVFESVTAPTSLLNPRPLAFCRPPLALLLLHSFVRASFPFQPDWFHSVQGRKALLWRFPVTLILMFSSSGLNQQQHWQDREDVFNDPPKSSSTPPPCYFKLWGILFFLFIHNQAL